MVARSDPKDYGKLEAFTMPTEINIKGPSQASNDILGTGDIASQFSLLNQQGSTVVLGNLQLLPIKDSVMYVQPVYVRANVSNSNTATFPQFRYVIVWYKNRAFMEGSLCAAVQQFPEFADVSFCAAAPTPPAPTPAPGPTPPTPPPTPTPGPTPPSTPPPPANASVAELLAAAQRAFADADAALRQDPPDFAEYARLVQQGRDLVNDALAASGGAPSTTTTASSAPAGTTPVSTIDTTAPTDSTTGGATTVAGATSSAPSSTVSSLGA
jgi:hypothetical protein